MIWKTMHISEEGLMARDFIQKMIHQNSGSTKQHDFGNCIGIVGGGPKGLYALEELLHCLNKEKIQGLWRILWWNETEDFGCGPNYQVDQPDYLLINYCIGHVDAWDRTRHLDNFHMSFMDWILKFKIIDQEVRPTDFASRSLVGQYLQHVTMQVIASKNENVELILIPEKVRDIQANFDDKLLIQSRDRDFRIDNLLLTTGHCYRNLPLIDFQEKSIPENYITSAYPLHHLDKIPRKQKVGIIGWGLTFIDVALQLTEGRGGKFDEEGNYIPSGKEPTIHPFSRNQLPIFPRGPIYGKNTYQLQYLNAKWLTDFYAIKRKRKIDFRTEIFPFLEKELRYAYYSTLLKSREVGIVESYISTLPENERFGYKDIFFPQIPESADLQKSYIDYLGFLIAEAERGELESPLMAACSVWREAGTMISSLYSEGGFTGESQMFLDKEMFSSFCRTTYGPPIENMKKIRSLLMSDVIQVHWLTPVDILHDSFTNQFILGSGSKEEWVNFLIDARIARPNLSTHNSTLYRNLWNNNLVEPYKNDAYRPGCININAVGKVISAKDVPLYIYGSNTEGFMLDNDSLSRKKNNILPDWVSEVIQQNQSLRPT